MKSKLIFLDVDGTLTPPGSNEVPASAARAICRARENGHKVFLCSGRNLPMLKPLLDQYPFDGAVGGGGGIVLVGDRLLYDCPMDQADFETAMRLLGENHVYRTIESKYGAWCDPGMGEFLAGVNGGNSELIRWRKALETDLGMKPMSEYPGCPAYKIIFLCENPAQLMPAREALEEKYRFLIQDTKHEAGCTNGEIINRNYDKGKGIRIAAKALGFDLADTIGFGDSMNDIEMAETVGIAVCMEDGSPNLKEKCAFICPPADRDGLAAAFDKLGLTQVSEMGRYF